MKALSVFYDASGFVHTAMGVAGDDNNKGYAEYLGYKYQKYPLGGVKFLIRKLCYQLSQNVDVAVMFDSRTDRKSLLPGYKAGRPRKLEVSSQLEFLYEELLRCNIAAYKVDGFEADDLLFTASKQLYNDYHKIALRVADYDIAHCVNDRVVLEALNTNVNDVNMYNFETALVKGTKIRFNTISAYKTFCGDNSDKIPKFLSASGISGEKMYRDFLIFVERFTSNGWNPEIPKNPVAIEKFLQYVDYGLTAEEKELLIKRRDVVFPRSADGVEFKAWSIKDIDVHRLHMLLNILDDYPSMEMLKMGRFRVPLEEQERFRLMADRLRTGEFAADNNMPMINESSAKSSTMEFREFTL